MIARSIHKDGPALFEKCQFSAELSNCQIAGCRVRIPARHLMCREHWFQVPEPMRTEVEASLAAWLAGAECVHRYFIARLQALIYVTRLLDGDVRGYEAQLAVWRQREAAICKPLV